MGGTDWLKVIKEGVKYFDTESGHFVHVLGNKVVVRSSSGGKITTFRNSRANTNRREASGRWQKCN